MSKKDKWILVADSGRARIFEVDRKTHRLNRAPLFELAQQVPASRDISRDRPGRTFESQGEGRHAKVQPTDPHRHLKSLFAHELAEKLDEERKKNAYRHLVVVAPPQMLGDLRKELDEQVRKMIVLEIDKDLSMLPPRELEGHLQDALRG